MTRFKRVLNQRFGFAVEMAGGFVEDENTRVFEAHPKWMAQCL
jgi:hypothetical protein